MIENAKTFVRRHISRGLDQNHLGKYLEYFHTDSTVVICPILFTNLCSALLMLSFFAGGVKGIVIFYIYHSCSQKRGCFFVTLNEIQILDLKRIEKIKYLNYNIIQVIERG
jgi:hypothetical protein